MNKEREYWQGHFLTEIKDNEVFVFGSNPEGRHGAGAAKAAMKFGAIYGQGRGLMGQSYGLVTKNLKAGYTEESTGITYKRSGTRSVSLSQIRENIKELYQCANNNPDKKFIISYKVNPDEKNLNGYSDMEILSMFIDQNNVYVPDNIIFHNSYKPLIEQYHKLKNEKFTFFWQSSSPFSQWHPAKFQYKEKTFSSAEQFMMYCKAKLFNDEDIAKKIIELNNTPVVAKFLNNEITSEEIINNKLLSKEWSFVQREIKSAGRKVKNYNELTWLDKRKSIVYVGSREKYKQNKHLLDKIKETDGTTLVEASPYDKIWGIGLKSSDARAQKRDLWQGENLLGEILTEVRENLKLENKPRNKIKP